MFKELGDESERDWGEGHVRGRDEAKLKLLPTLPSPPHAVLQTGREEKAVKFVTKEIK
jgi:hypothetical protein